MTDRNAHSRGQRVEGFEFEIQHDGAVRTVLLQGDGGRFGAGWLCALNSVDARTSPEQAAKVLLTKAQALAVLREHVPHTRGGGSFDVIKIEGATVLACRPLLFQEQNP